MHPSGLLFLPSWQTVVVHEPEPVAVLELAVLVMFVAVDFPPYLLATSMVAYSKMDLEIGVAAAAVRIGSVD